MSARHEDTHPTKTKKIDSNVDLVFKELQKLQSTQLPIPLTLIQASGKGLGGGGTVFPIHFPIEDLGVISTSPITLNLTSARTHYIKMQIDTITDLVIELRELAQGKSVHFILDITINTISPAFNSITFDPVVDFIPDFPKLAGSRFLIEMQGMNTDGIDERYEILNSGSVGGFAGVIITPVTENTNPASNENINLATFQHYVFHLDSNITITFINPPTNLQRAEQFVLEFIQDNVGSRTLAVTNTIHPSVPALDATPLSRTVITGFAYKDFAGNVRYDMYLVGN